MDTDAAKTVSKIFIQKTEEVTGDLIGNRIAYKITSACKTKSKEKEKENEVNAIQELYISSEKRQQIIDAIRLL